MTRMVYNKLEIKNSITKERRGYFVMTLSMQLFCLGFRLHYVITGRTETAFTGKGDNHGEDSQRKRRRKKEHGNLEKIVWRMFISCIRIIYNKIAQRKTTTPFMSEGQGS